VALKRRRTSIRTPLTVLTILAAPIAAAGCTTSSQTGGAATGNDVARTSMDAPHNTLTEAERDEGWRLLFDGETLAGWRGYESAMPPEGWRAEEGALHRFGSGGDIMTVDPFGDFELSLDWKISEGGNSGIFYRVVTGLDHIYTGAPEMQVLDDAHHPDGENPISSAGSVFAIYPAPRGVVHPAGEWNRVRIVVIGNHVEQWLNGEKIVEYELGSPDWKKRVAASKFADVPQYGAAREGHIGLQDHGDDVWFRDIRIRPLDQNGNGS